MDDIRSVLAKAKGKSEMQATKAALAKKPAAKLVDMRYTKTEISDRNSPSKSSTSYPGDSEKYPYGLTLRLDHEAMKKLGIKLPAVGETVEICAKAMVTEAESRETTGGGKRESCSLQIQKLKVG